MVIILNKKHVIYINILQSNNNRSRHSDDNIKIKYLKENVYLTVIVKKYIILQPVYHVVPRHIVAYLP